MMQIILKLDEVSAHI